MADLWPGSTGHAGPGPARLLAIPDPAILAVMSDISTESVPITMPDQAAARSAPAERPPEPEPASEVITDTSVGQTVDVTA
jgi:hypothetical protein